MTAISKDSKRRLFQKWYDLEHEAVQARVDADQAAKEYVVHCCPFAIGELITIPYRGRVAQAEVVDIRRTRGSSLGYRPEAYDLLCQPVLKNGTRGQTVWIDDVDMVWVLRSNDKLKEPVGERDGW